MTGIPNPVLDLRKILKFEIKTNINIMTYDKSLENLTCIYSIIFTEMHMGEAAVENNSQNNPIVFHI